jgi:hypothetical protein
MLCPECGFNFYFLDNGKGQKCKIRIGLSNTEIGALMVSGGLISDSLTMCVHSSPRDETTMPSMWFGNQ